MTAKTVLNNKVVIVIPDSRGDDHDVRGWATRLTEIAGGSTARKAWGSWVAGDGEVIVEEVWELEVRFNDSDTQLVRHAVESLADVLMASGEEAVLVTYNDEAVLYSKEEEE